MSAVTTSSRRPGTCHRKSSGCACGRQGDRQVDRDAVVRGTRLERVGQRQLRVERPEGPASRELLVDVVCVVAHEQVAGIRQQVRRAATGGLPPPVERAHVRGLGGDPLVEELDEHLVVDHEPRRRTRSSSSADLVDEPGVVLDEAVVAVPLAPDERVPDEQLAGHDRVDPGVLHAAAGHQGYAVERDPLVGDDGAALLRPPRLGVGPADQVAGDLLHPLRVDPCDHAAEEPAVSTISAAIANAGGLRERAEPGWIAQRAPRAPR